MDTDMSTKNDTIRLAGHCDAGCKMAIDSMDQISRYVTDDNLRNVISSSKNRHKDLEQGGLRPAEQVRQKRTGPPENGFRLFLAQH